MSIFLGIDGGGSKTSCVVGDENSVLGDRDVRRQQRGSGWRAPGASELWALPYDRPVPRPTLLRRKSKEPVSGIAGGALPEIAEVVRGLLSEFVSGEVEVVGDMVIAMEAAFGSGPGVIVIAGTGSIAYGRNSAGQTARAGGWGFAISDEGSGHWIGRSAVAACMRAYDEVGVESGGVLLESIMKFWGVSTRERVVVVANGSPPPDFAALLPAVLSASDAGDATARSILTQAGVELATLGKIVIGRIFDNAGPVPVAVSGGVFCNCELVREVFYDRVRAWYPQVLPNATLVDPARGALELARKSGFSS